MDISYNGGSGTEIKNAVAHSAFSSEIASASMSGASNLLSLKVRFVDSNIIKTLQFDPSTLVFDVLRIIREKIPETSSTNAQNYGIFISNSDSSKGTWLESNRTLEYYLLKNGDTIDYKNKFRKLCIKLLDGQTKTLMVDDSQTVSQLMVFICSKMGIANYEEYSLIHEIQLTEKEKTQTLKKDKTLNRDHKKMEELKRKLHTDDDIAWLDHSKTLRQQNVDESSCLILKRKLFFSDKNIDTRDPVQLNLLYVQCRDGILNGTHPINEEEAIKFAAIQCQIKFGNYVDSYKSGFLELKEYLPKEYIKTKGIEKKIFHEWKSPGLVGVSELDGRLKYIQLCRSLKTYGVTFFLVKEKMDGKNKLITRLLGISKESIIRVDEKTKEFLHVYPLECVKKWAASPNTFTLDFGDHYKDPYFSMQTTEGEHIARLISGYIDIILKKKKAKEFVSNDAYEETPMLEEVVSPSKATVIQINKTNINQSVTGNVILPGILRNSSQEGPNQSIPPVNTPTPNIEHINQDHLASKLLQLQKPLVTTIENARAVINNAQANLNQRPVLVDVGNDPASIQWRVNMLDVNKQNATSHLSAMNAATAQVVTLTSSGQQNTDYNAVGAAVSTISTNLGDFSKDVMMLAALQQQDHQIESKSDDGSNSRLLGAARKLCSTFGDFLRYVEPECKEPRQNLFSAVSRIGEAGNEFMHSINEDDELHPSANHQTQSYRLQEIIIGMAKMVASSTAGLVIASKNVANHCSTQQGVNEVIALVTQCALSTSQLVSCTKVCSSTIGSRECQDQIVEAAKQVQKQVRMVVDVARQNCQNDQALNELGSCASNVSAAVNQLLDNVSASNERIVNILTNNNGSSRVENREGSMEDNRSSFYNGQSQAIERIYSATDHLFDSMNDPPEMIKQAKILAQATTELVNLLKQEAHVQSTNEKQKKLLLTAKLLAEATARIVESAKCCAADPKDDHAKNNLRRSVDELKKATSTILSGGEDDEVFTSHQTTDLSPEFKLIKQLELSAKQAASCATQAIAAIQVCILHAEGDQALASRQPSTHHLQQQLIQQCKVVADHVPKIVQGIRACMVQPRAKSAHLSLISASEDFLMPAYKMISLTKSVLPTIANEIKTIQLRNCTNQLINALSDLKNWLAKTEQVCSSFESDAMIESIRSLENELNQIYSTALKPLPGETLESCEAELAHISKTVGSTMAQMISAAAQGNEVNTGLSAKETLNSLRSFTSCIRAIVACKMANGTNNSSAQCQKLIESAHQVLDQACTLVIESKQALYDINNLSDENGTGSSSQQRLTQIARVIVQSLYDCVNCLPGQKDIDEVIKRMGKVTSILLSIEDGDVLNAGRQYEKTINDLENELNQTAVSLNQSANQLVIEANHGDKAQLGELSNSLADNFDLFLQLCLAFIGIKVESSGEKEKHIGEMIRSLKDLHTMCSKLLHAVKSSHHPGGESIHSTGRQQLSTSVKQLTESLNATLAYLNHVDNNNTIPPGLRECESALRAIETTRTILNANIQQGADGQTVVNEPPTLTNTLQSYYDCLDFIIDQSRLLGESITGLANSCKSPSHSESTKPIRETSNALCELVETAMHSAYIIGSSDAESQSGQPPLLDTAHFLACAQHIHDTCAYLEYILLDRNNESFEPETIQKQLIQCATQIAHSTASLCTASQHASNKTTNMLAKRHFVQSAKQVANATANFVKAIKSIEVTDFKENGSMIDQLSNLMRQLTDSVDSLCQYASSPEFFGVQASLGQKGIQAQQPILSAARIMLDSGAHLIQASKSLLISNSDPQMWQQFSSNSKLISESIKKLATSIKEKAPAKVECDQALAQLEKCLKLIESALIALAMNQDIASAINIEMSSSSVDSHREHAVSCATQISDLVDQLRQAAKCEADRLAHLVTEIAQFFQPFVLNVIQCSAKPTESNIQKQTLLLEQCKTVVESMLQLLIASKENAGNPKSKEGGNNNSLHQAIDENADGTKEVIEDLIQTLEEGDPSRAENLVTSIRNMDINDMGENLSEEQKQLVFKEYEIKIKQITYTLQQILQEMPGSVSNPADLGHHAQQLTQTYNCLILACKGYIHNAWMNHESESDPSRITNQSARIKSIAQDLGKSCIDLIQLTGQLTNSNLNNCNGLEEEEINNSKTELIKQCSSVNDCAQQLINCFNESSIDPSTHVSRVFVPNPSQGVTNGEHACHSAQQAIDGILADLNTVCMFASAGTLKSDVPFNDSGSDQVDSFGNHRESVLRSAKTLVEDTKALVSASGSLNGVDQPTLARCIQTSVKTIGRLADSVKLAAASLGSDQSDTQILVLNAVRDVAASLKDLVATIKILARNQDGNSSDNTNMLSDSAKNMITNVQSLLKTIKAVEDEAQRGTRALEAAVDAIYQEIRQYSSYLNSSSLSSFISKENVMPEDLIKATRQITLATSKAIGAGNSLRQEDVIVAANMGRKAVSDLLYVCYNVVIDPSEDQDQQRKNIITVGLNCAIFYKELLDSILNAFNKSASSDSSTVTVNKQNLIVYSKNVAGAVTDIIKIAESLKSTDGWVDPEDPASIAENELLGAADAIDSAAKKLSRLKPRTKTETLNENLNFDEQILEFAKSITNAAGALISSATDAQKELVAQGKLKPVSSKYNEEDGQWSQGLISAARLVAAACHTLCEAANGLVQGHGTEERLISSAKQVASSTAALLVACQVKSDKQSQSMKRLQNAGNAVKRATDALVRSAQQASDANHEEEKYLELNTKFVGSMAQEIMLREEILRKERELKAAQAAYNAVKKARYQREENSPTSSAGSCSNSSSSNNMNNLQSSTNNTN